MIEVTRHHPNDAMNRSDEQNNPPKGWAAGLAAERVGFEPTVEKNPTPVFETGPFNHSGTFPCDEANI